MVVAADVSRRKLKLAEFEWRELIPLRGTATELFDPFQARNRRPGRKSGPGPARANQVLLNEIDGHLSAKPTSPNRQGFFGTPDSSGRRAA
jgi:hypothetical protein